MINQPILLRCLEKNFDDKVNIWIVNIG